MNNEDNQGKKNEDNKINNEKKDNNKSVILEKINFDKSQKNKKIYENQLTEKKNIESSNNKIAENNVVDKLDNKKKENNETINSENKILCEIMDNNEIIDNKGKKNIEYPENKIIDNISIENKIDEEKNENKINDINKDEKKPKNFGHSKMKLVYEEIKKEALNKSKKRKEEKKAEEEKKTEEENQEQNLNVINNEEPKIEDVYKNVTEDGGIQKKILKKGKGEPPSNGKMVFIFYKSKYKDKIFAQTKENTVFSFTIGENKVIKGWEIALKSMQIGERAEFIMTSDYTYGDKQFNDSIPAKSTLTYEIELVGVSNNDSGNELDKMTYDEKLQWGQLLKKEGVEKFKSNDIIGAKECFIKALSFLKTMDPEKEEEKEGVDLYLTTLSNICNCFNKEKEYNSVIYFSSMGLNIKLLPKLLYFRAIAYAYTEEFESANNDLDNLSKVLLTEKGEGTVTAEEQKNIEQTLNYIKDIINERKKIYIEKNKNYSRAIFRQYLYNDKPLVNNTLIPPLEPNPDNPFVFFEIKIGEKSVGKIIFELYKNVVPMTAENFRFLCVNDKEGMTFKGTYLNKMIKNFVIGGGELENNKEKEKCIYGEYFDDENYIYCHCRRGLLTMDNEGKNKNNSKFLITLKYIPWFDGKHVVFGQIIKGMEIIKDIEEIETDNEDKPMIKIIIEDCGEIFEKDEFIIKKENNQKENEIHNIEEEKEEKKEEKKEGEDIIKEEKEKKEEEKIINEELKKEEEKKIINEEKVETGIVKNEEKTEEDKKINKDCEENDKKEEKSE